MRSRAIPLALALALVPAAPAAAAEPVCVGDSIAPLAPDELVLQAVDVLRASGHDPARYRVELRKQDPFTAAGTGREPQLRVVFLPLEADPGYAVAVDPADPCVVSWLWQPEGYTPWQQEVIERARRSTSPQPSGGATEIRATETRGFVGVRWTAADGTERRVVVRKGDLEVLDRNGLPSAPRENGTPRSD